MAGTAWPWLHPVMKGKLYKLLEVGGGAHTSGRAIITHSRKALERTCNERVFLVSEQLF